MEDISLTIWTDGEHLPETTANLCLPIICLSAVVALHSILNLHVFVCHTPDVLYMSHHLRGSHNSRVKYASITASMKPCNTREGFEYLYLLPCLLCSACLTF